MENRDIALRAGEFVRAYRNEQGSASRTTRRKHRYPMVVLFLESSGEREDSFDFNACSEIVKNTARAFWVNHETIAYATVSAANYKTEIAEACRKALKDDKTESAASISVSIITKSYDTDYEKIGNVIEETVANLQFRVGSNIDFTLYTLVSTIDPDEVRAFKGQFNYIQDYMENAEAIKMCPIRAFIIGNTLSESNHQISNGKMYESLASNIILINNSDTVASVTLNDFFAPRKITLTGFSKADIPLETVYVIGFDIFSDIVMEFFKKGQSEVVPEYSFDIENDILRVYTSALKTNAARYAAAARHLLCNHSLVAGTYNYAQINAEFYGNIEKYIDINMERDRIAVPNEEAICDQLDEYLLNYFELYGLTNAEKLLQNIVNKERTKMNAAQPDFLAQPFVYDPENPACLQPVIQALIRTKISRLVTFARETIIKHIENSNTNIIQIIANTMEQIQASTETCKNESISMDNEMSAELVKKYENTVIGKRDEIEDTIRRKAMSFNFKDAGTLVESIFLYFEERIVKSVLFGNLNNYEDDVERMSYDEAKAWINSQEDKADLSLRLTNKNVNTTTIFLTNMDPNTDRNDRLNNVMLYMKENNYKILPVSGMPVFRCLKYRTQLQTTDLFVFQYTKD